MNGTPGFGLGQMLTQGDMGAAQMAQPTGQAGGGGFLSGLAGLLQGGGQMGQMDMSQLMPLMQMLQMQKQAQAGQQAPQMMGAGPMAGMMTGMSPGQTQAQRGYLAQGGGIAPRQVINRGY